MNKAQAMAMMGVTEFPDGWEFTPVYRHHKLAGFFCVKDNEIHCFRASNEGCWLSRQDIERLTKPIFQKFGFLLTSVRSSNKIGQKFVTRLGFFKIKDESGIIYYKAERLKHARH